ncbi:MAG: hypothetical protein WAN65_30380 [Candidatus Sulfotelmatobacter sp.]
MTNPITVVDANIQVAPTPLTLQQTGALISQGATTLAAQGTKLLTQISDLTSILNGAAALTSLSYTSQVVTATTTAPHGIPTSNTFDVTISGAVAAGYNGTFLATSTGASTFTYPIEANPGSASIPGSYTLEDVAELTEMATTFFGMGSQLGVYVLELGEGSPAQGVTTLTNFINNNAQEFYAYLVPRTWAAESTYLTMLASFEEVTSKTYFFTTATLQNYSNFTAAMKCALVLVEAPAYGAWPANVISAASYTAPFASWTTTTNHGVAVGQWFQISGMTPAGYNGWFQAQEGTTGTTLIATPLAALGAESGLGTLVASTGTSAGIGANEFSIADAFWTVLNWNPSSANRVTPLSFAFMFGDTPFPLKGNSSLLTTLANDNINYIGTGAEGGISTSCLFFGRTMDGNQFNYWYSIDWLQLNCDQAISNAVINGSNNPISPLWYNQNGITTLQSVVASTVKNGIGAGLILGALTLVELDPTTFAQNVASGVYAGQAVVNAVPFATYVAANPSNYAAGKYGGLSVAFTPQTGFQQITINLTAVQFAAAA